MRFYIRFFSLAGLICLVSLFSQCSNKPERKVDTFGELDTNKVAADTSMQVNMDRSYEYQKTLIQNDSVVFDFIAYDKPVSSSTEWTSKFIIIRRTKARQDTVVKGSRMGPVCSLGIGDMDQDGKPEIFFYDGSSVTKNRWVLNIFRFVSDTSYEYIRWRQLDAISSSDHYNGDDTFFVYKNYMVRRYPYHEHYDDRKTNGYTWQSYRLQNGKMQLQKESYAKD